MKPNGRWREVKMGKAPGSLQGQGSFSGTTVISNRTVRICVGHLIFCVLIPGIREATEP